MPVKVYIDSSHKNSIIVTLTLTLIIRKDAPKNVLEATMEEVKAFANKYSIAIPIIALVILFIIIATKGSAAGELLPYLKSILFTV